MIAFSEDSFWMDCHSLLSCVFYGLFHAFQVTLSSGLSAVFPLGHYTCQDHGTSALTAVRIPNSNDPRSAIYVQREKMDVTGKRPHTG